MKKVKLGDLWEESKIVSESPSPEKRIRVRLNVQGVEQRPISEDKGNGTKYFIRKAGQFIYGKQNLHKGAFGIIPNELDGFESSSDIPAFDIVEDCDPEWLFYYFKQGDFYKDLERYSKGTGSKRIHPDKIAHLEIPLPSLSEQKQILEKINSIKTEIEKLSQNTTHDEILLKKLKQAILSEAVQGKLVSQDKNDESAIELLKKIKNKEDKLIREGKIKKQKELASISDDEIPYELPKGWAWCRLGEVCQINPRNKLDNNLGVSFIPMNLIKDNARNQFGQQIKKWNEIKSGFTHFAEDDVIFAKITPCFQNRNSAILKNLKNGFGAGTTELYVLRSYGRLILPGFLFLLVNTKKFIDDGVATYKGTAGQQRIKREFVEDYIVGIPPLSEQKRIVEKVDSLMKFCDELELRIKENKNESDNLMKSILREVFEE